jgi:hypothetical protein
VVHREEAIRGRVVVVVRFLVMSEVSAYYIEALM